MIPQLSPANFPVLLFITGAILAYVEFLRPGLILPGVIGAALIIFSIAAFLKPPINWAGVVVLFLTFAMGLGLLSAHLSLRRLNDGWAASRAKQGSGF